ncbi:MAG: hypothetical protein IPK93_07565 [Solirubrobacterales bacterium]|nr:hypothetical protein [Solirubrobacterales bacterium]
MPVKTVRNVSAALLIAVSLAVVGCGSSDDDSSPATDSTGTTAPATSSSTTGDPRPRISDEAAAAYDAAANKYNALNDENVAKINSSADPSGNIDPDVFQEASSNIRDGLFNFDAEVRTIDLGGYEVERNALLEAIGTHIAVYDAINAANGAQEIAAQSAALGASTADFKKASAAMLNALNNG